MLNKIADINCFKLSYQRSFLLMKSIFELFLFFVSAPVHVSHHFTFK